MMLPPFILDLWLVRLANSSIDWAISLIAERNRTYVVSRWSCRTLFRIFSIPIFGTSTYLQHRPSSPSLSLKVENWEAYVQEALPSSTVLTSIWIWVWRGHILTSSNSSSSSPRYSCTYLLHLLNPPPMQNARIKFLRAAVPLIISLQLLYVSKKSVHEGTSYYCALTMECGVYLRY